ncbi:MAG: isocitrate dehydrogenase (NADP(+)) [Proteobacteria bacterium]|jgi:isocitrate dehydrogenase|nr:isocitrate dehydrogenase (NADP(+)) [Pseudomonadota bacterium]
MKSEKVTSQNGKINVPDYPIIPFIEGDGVGVDIWKASQPVFNAAIEIAYGTKKKVEWKEIYAGEKANAKFGSFLPDETLKEIKDHTIAIKGPLGTPTGGGIRSINVALRQIFDLYACIRPIRYFDGVPAPVKHPEKVDMTIFRENTEDVYSGIEWESNSAEAKKLIAYMQTELKSKAIVAESGIGIKPISPMGSKRLVRSAIQFAIAQKKPSVTIIHKGNIMKYTEGSFMKWGFEVAAQEFADQTITETEVMEKHGGKAPAGKVVIKERIADAMFQQALLRPDEYSVLATTNLNGDYLSDALIAQVGGLGLGPGANVGTDIAMFEATHGTAPKHAGKDSINPGSLILSGVMMFEHMGWNDVGALISRGLQQTIAQKKVTYDLERQMQGATLLKCSEFGQAIVANMRKL